MKFSNKLPVVSLMLAMLLALSIGDAQAQFTGQWLDIGEYHHIYVESGARAEAASGTVEGMEWPAILRESSHGWAKAFWIGVKNWTDDRGESFNWHVARIGPRSSGQDVTFPVQNKLISRYEDVSVEVDGALSFDNVAVVDEVDASIPADRMIDNIHNMRVGVTTNRKIYAWTNEFHDQYHIIEYEYCNTGNTDDDEEIELPNQTLNDTYFFRVHRWRANAQEAWQASAAQTWGKFSMVDVVGDGHAEYPVDFTAQWLWPGFDPQFTQFNNLGGALFEDSHWTVASGDSVGRLSGGSMVGRMTLHADRAPGDATYDKCNTSNETTCQPRTTGFMDQDEPLTGESASHEDYYELGILTRENPALFPGGSSHMLPHYADRIEPDGKFWEPTSDASSGKQGGHAATTAYGPYQMNFGDCVNVALAEGVGGLSYDARVQIGKRYKRGGDDRETDLIGYDANGDGTISSGTFDYSMVGLPTYQAKGCTNCPNRGPEMLTKNQWVMTARDSLFQNFFRAKDVYARLRSGSYPVPEPPRPPKTFKVDGRPNQIELTWEAFGDGPNRTGWEIYRTRNFEDNLLSADAGNPSHVGYQKVATLDGSATSYNDTEVTRGTDYYYYIVAVGGPQGTDASAMDGTPNGTPLRSSRYLTQTYQPVNLKRPPYGQSSGATGTVKDARVVPNPVNLGSEPNQVRFDQEDRVAFFNIPGQCTIKIYTELGELVKELKHTDGSGDELWNLTTDSRQLLVSGIYIAVIEDQTPGKEGEKAFLKFVVIR